MCGWAVLKIKSNRTVERTVTESNRALNACFILYFWASWDAEQERERKKNNAHIIEWARERKIAYLCRWCALVHLILLWLLFGSVYSVNSIVVYYIVRCMSACMYCIVPHLLSCRIYRRIYANYGTRMWRCAYAGFTSSTHTQIRWVVPCRKIVEYF